jgi:nickel-dependent lactate racemase
MMVLRALNGDTDGLKTEAITEYLAEALGRINWGGKNVLLIIPDRTRTAPVAEMLRIIHPVMRDLGMNIDIVIALGTHQPLSREEIMLHLKTNEESFLEPAGKVDKNR